MKAKKTYGTIIGFAISVVLLSGTLMRCGSDDEGPDQTPPFLGTFAVEEIDPATGDVEESYDIFISKVSATEVDIDNFRFFVVPIRATISGTNMTIKAQSFTQGSITIEITGSGELDSNELTYDYTLKGYINKTFFCVATRK